MKRERERSVCVTVKVQWSATHFSRVQHITLTLTAECVCVCMCARVSECLTLCEAGFHIYELICSCVHAHCSICMYAYISVCVCLRPCTECKDSSAGPEVTEGCYILTYILLLLRSESLTSSVSHVMFSHKPPHYSFVITRTWPT